MGADKYDFTVEQGTDFELEIVLKNDNNQIINLTGYSARMQIRPFKMSDEIYYNANTNNNLISIDAPNGVIKILFPNNLTEQFTWSKGVYDLEIINNSNKVSRLIEGTVNVSKEVTRN